MMVLGEYKGVLIFLKLYIFFFSIMLVENLLVLEIKYIFYIGEFE